MKETKPRHQCSILLFSSILSAVDRFFFLSSFRFISWTAALWRSSGCCSVSSDEAPSVSNWNQSRLFHLLLLQVALSCHFRISSETFTTLVSVHFFLISLSVTVCVCASFLSLCLFSKFASLSCAWKQLCAIY